MSALSAWTPSHPWIQSGRSLDYIAFGDWRSDCIVYDKPKTGYLFYQTSWGIYIIEQFISLKVYITEILSIDLNRNRMETIFGDYHVFPLIFCCDYGTKVKENLPNGTPMGIKPAGVILLPYVIQSVKRFCLNV